MNFYYIIRNDKTVYTLAAKSHITLETLGDKNAKYIVPINFFQWIYIRIKFGNKK